MKIEISIIGDSQDGYDWLKDKFKPKDKISYLNDCLNFFAKFDGEIVGHISTEDVIIRDEQYSIIFDLYVVPSKRNMGIAKKLIEYVEKVSKDAHKKTDYMTVMYSRVWQRDYFKKLGYEKYHGRVMFKKI